MRGVAEEAKTGCEFLLRRKSQRASPVSSYLSAGASEKPRGQVSLQVLHLACVIKFAFLNPGMLGASV